MVLYIKDIFHVVCLTNTYCLVGNVLDDSMLMCRESTNASVLPYFVFIAVNSGIYLVLLKPSYIFAQTFGKSVFLSRQQPLLAYEPDHKCLHLAGSSWGHSSDSFLVQLPSKALCICMSEKMMVSSHSVKSSLRPA